MLLLPPLVQTLLLAISQAAAAITIQRIDQALSLNFRASGSPLPCILDFSAGIPPMVGMTHGDGCRGRRARQANWKRLRRAAVHSVALNPHSTQPQKQKAPVALATGAFCLFKSLTMTYLGSEQARYPFGTPAAPHPGTFGASGVTWRLRREVGRDNHRILNIKKAP